jgi:RimJ/RimL family protein N-acetyltransferase
MCRLTAVASRQEQGLKREARGTEQTLGVFCTIFDTDNDKAEFAIFVRLDLKGRGLCTLRMQALTAHLGARGTRRLTAYVLKKNARMLQLVATLGMSPTSRTRTRHGEVHAGAAGACDDRRKSRHEARRAGVLTGDQARGAIATGPDGT